MTNKIFSISFCILLIVFSVVNFVKPQNAFSDNENRALSKAPKFSVDSFLSGKFATDYEKFTSDQFICRDFWVSTKANLEKISGKTENNGVYFAKDGYLIEKMPNFNAELMDKNIESIKKFAGSGKYNVTFMLIPTAFEILNDKLPANAYNDVQKRVISYNRERLMGTIINFIDPTDTLNKHKDEYLYFRTDHHQSANGGFYGYRHLLNSMGQTPYDKDDFNISVVNDEFFGTTWSKATIKSPPDEIIKYEPKFDISYSVNYEDVGKTSDSLYADSRLTGKDKYQYYLDGNHATATITSSVKNGKTLAVFKDSYAHSILPFLANHYETIHVIDLRYCNFDPIVYLDNYKVTDILFLYSISNYMTDRDFVKIGAFIQ